MTSLLLKNSFSVGRLRCVAAFKNQAKFATATQADVIQLIIEDHHIIQNEFEKMKRGPDEEAEEHFDNLMWMIARHSAGEELIIHPVLQHLGYGKKIAEYLEDHLSIRSHLRDVKKKPFTPASRLVVSNIMKEVFDHIVHEEAPGGELDGIRKGCDSAQLQTMGKQFERTKMLAPKFYKLRLPEKPPFAHAAQLMMERPENVRQVFDSLPDVDVETITIKT